jgi:mono/diheme cytochrome c family protein
MSMPDAGQNTPAKSIGRHCVGVGHSWEACPVSYGGPCLHAMVILLFMLAIFPMAQAAPAGPKLGKPLTAQELAGLDINVFPDGSGLPPGKGSAVEGKTVYDAQCAACHGVKGSGGSAGELAGRSALNGPHPDQTVGNYWPYATTIFDFVRRSMPLNAPRRLSDDQVYAVTAYLLHINGIIEASDEMNARILPEIRMPTREGFIRIWPNGQGVRREGS